jgi:hypothetical protein
MSKFQNWEKVNHISNWATVRSTNLVKQSTANLIIVYFSTVQLLSEQTTMTLSLSVERHITISDFKKTLHKLLDSFWSVWCDIISTYPPPPPAPSPHHPPPPRPANVMIGVSTLYRPYDMSPA